MPRQCRLCVCVGGYTHFLFITSNQPIILLTDESLTVTLDLVNLKCSGMLLLTFQMSFFLGRLRKESEVYCLAAIF